MCWNWEVSIGFAIGLSLASLFLLKRRSLKLRGSERDPYEALLVLNLAFVQFWEFLIWLTVYDADKDLSLCPKSNTAFTSMVYFHGVLFWPPIVNLLAYKTTKGVKEYFAFPLLFGCLYTLLGFFDFFYSQFDIAGQFTCGLDGKVFLRWNIALSQSRILPNGYDWFLFTAFPFVFYIPRPLGIFMVLYLMATFAIPYALVTLGEAASVFCWLGFGICLVFLAEPYIQYYMTRRFPFVSRFDIVESMQYYFNRILGRQHKHQSLRSPITSEQEIEIPSINEMKESNDSTTELP